MRKKHSTPIYKLELLSENNHAGEDSYLSPQINIALKGFKNQQLVHPEEVAEFLAAFPRTHLSGLRLIEFERHKTHYFNNYFSRRIRGRFYLRDKKIVIEGIKNRKTFFYILCHELGHFVFYHVVDSYTKKEWVTELYKSSGYVSKYSRRSGSEDFAECYAHYALNKQRLNEYSIKKNFIHHKVFNMAVVDNELVERILSSETVTTGRRRRLDIRF